MGYAKICEEIKKGKCPEPRQKKKSETRGKNGQVSDSRIRGVYYPPEKRKEKDSPCSAKAKIKEEER